MKLDYHVGSVSSIGSSLKIEERGLLEHPDLDEALRVSIRLAQQHEFPTEYHGLRSS